MSDMGEQDTRDEPNNPEKTNTTPKRAERVRNVLRRFAVPAHYLSGTGTYGHLLGGKPIDYVEGAGIAVGIKGLVKFIGWLEKFNPPKI